MKKQWTIEHWMTKDPLMISVDCSVKKAFTIMEEKKIRHLLVVENQKLMGIVSDRDLRRPTAPEGGELDYFYRLDDTYEVQYVMTKQVKFVYNTDYIGKAAQIFKEERFGAIPVVDKDENVVGILSIYDILDAFSEAFSVFTALA
ncbi:CBS domain-containing protein [Candidatus Uabimicrobium amorphum]|uniref:Acetoin dehydrogenase n=1 Tax=Uabimicrobium amorphum TaxID=2596890 RepID=A0A5S9IJW9_UABAM|nr:CBS domain-containing protein [Candidatus Uabimicrobium amorphum]BBM82410.1 acetoin dehydrogenase [Candidatus Uabimicrobium amorphum]